MIQRKTNPSRMVITVVFTDVTVLDANGFPTALATPTSARQNTFALRAADPGSWGRSLGIQAIPESATRAEVDSIVSAPSNSVQLKHTNGFYVNAWVEFDNGATRRYRKITSVNGNVQSSGAIKK